MNARARVVLLSQSTFPILVCLVIVAVIFTITPEALDHSPVAFETRGLVHHIWHYGLLIGSLAALGGALTTDRRGLTIELVGLVLVVIALAFNLTTLIADSVGPDSEPLRGVGIALRAGAMLQLVVRVWILVVRPTASIEVGRTDA